MLRHAVLFPAPEYVGSGAFDYTITLGCLNSARYWETIVGSRALIIKGKRLLVPFADMFNYMPQRGERRAHSYVSIESIPSTVFFFFAFFGLIATLTRSLSRLRYGDFFLHYHRVEDGAFKVFADRATRAEEQVFEDYGDNPNSVYLQHHGFVPDHNPFDCVRMPLPVGFAPAPYSTLHLGNVRGLETDTSERIVYCL